MFKFIVGFCLIVLTLCVVGACSPILALLYVIGHAAGGN